LFKRFRKEVRERKEGGEGHYYAACEIVKLRALGYSAEADATEAIYIQDGWIGTRKLFPRLGIDLADYLQRYESKLGTDKAAELLSSPEVFELAERLFEARHGKNTP
jgi:hypothetical protein